MEFSTAFREFIADGHNNNHAEIIRTVNLFAGSISDVLSNTKGLTRFVQMSAKLINSSTVLASRLVLNDQVFPGPPVFQIG